MPAKPPVANSRTLSRRALNRALLARQLLLERTPLGPVTAIAQVGGLQAQVQNPPFIGLWSRLRGFEREHLHAAMDARQVVRVTAMRSTLHLLTSEDYLAWRTPLQPALERALQAFHGRNIRDLDLAPIIAAAARVFAEGPATGVQLRAVLSAIAPDRDPNALEYAARTFLALVQLPPGGFWRVGGSPQYAAAADWIGRPVSSDPSPAALIRRYLAACGPAGVMDAQAWAGMARLKEAFEALRPELVTYRDEAGVELFDLPGAPLPDEDTPAPVRLLPEYDHVVLSHANRSRVISDAHKPGVFLTAGRVRATFLVDGFVRGAWALERKGKSAILTLEPFAPLEAVDRAALDAEAETLLRWAEPEAAAFGVRWQNG